MKQRWAHFEDKGGAKDIRSKKTTDQKQTYIPGYSKSVMILKSMNVWNKFFIDYDDDNLMGIAEKRKNRQIKKDDERFPFEG